MLFRFLLSVHRWLGVALCLLFLLWFPSGIGMMYWGMPSVTARDRLERAPVLDPGKVVLSPQEAAGKAGLEPSPAQVRLNSYDGRPVYRFTAGGRGAGAGRIIYADTGEEQGVASELIRHRAAAAWTSMAASDAVVEAVTEIDQWMVGNQLRNLRPLWKYSWPNGENVYIGESGEVLMHTTPASRLKAYVSAVPHWLYFTPLRKHQPFWIRFATYTAMIGTAGVLIGMVIAIWLYSPRQKKYRYAGAPSSIPYRGQKRWHTIFGLVFGLATFTWTLSGSLAFLPFPAAPAARPQLNRAEPSLPGTGRARGQQRQGPRAQNQASQDQASQDQASQGPTSQGQASQGQARGGQAGQGQGNQARGRRGGDTGLAAALRGRVRLDDFAAAHPRDLLARRADLQVKELEFTSFAGQPLFDANLGDGSSQLLATTGQSIDGFDDRQVIDIVRTSLSDARELEIQTVTQYDYYYLDRTRQRPLPVILALTHDAAGTRYYIDPKTGTVAGTYSDRNWARRFFYNGLHSLSFPWLYNHRPLWDIVVITFMLGGTALCVTALVLAWRAVGKKLKQLVPGRPAASPAFRADPV